MSTKLNPSKLGTYGSIEVRNEQEVTNPLLRARLPDCYESASWWSQLTFNWLSPVLEIGNVKGRLDVEDLKTLPLPQDDTTSHVMEQFRQSWEAEKVRAMAMNKDPKVVRALWNAYYLDFCKAGFLKLVHDLLQFVGPQVLYHLIEFLRTPGSPMWYGLSLTLGVTAAQLLMSLTLRHYFFVCYRVGLRLRTAVIMAVYQKALVLADSRKSVGEITNLMSVDAQRLQDMISYLHSVWYSFLQIGLAIFFLWQQLGVSILAGVLVIILSIPLTAVTANMMGKLQKELMTSKDKRIEVNNEVLGQMRVVKLQAWEKPFQEKLEALRGVELTKLLHYLIGRMLTFLTWSAVPLTISITTFGTYAILGNKLDVASALTALALFEILRFPLFMLPSTINSMVEANVALNRINNFLTSPEHKAVTPGSQHDVGAEIVDGSFVYENKRPETSTQHGNLQFARSLSDAEWEMELLREQLAHAERKLASVEGRVAPPAFGGSNLLSLSRINLTVKKGEFVAIVGGVGCGKSSLLKALMGEIRKLSGDVSVCGSVSYSAQTAFIMNDTVKNNILFGKPDNNPELYNKAIRVCALEHDLDLLPHGDQTEIGEKGITLSGGQKTRIGMARALYHDADLFLLDDPLAAVDAHVGRQLFDQCIVDSMLSNDRSVVLVTNALQFLSHPRVDRIVVLKDGESIESGSFNELNSNSSSQFRRLLDSLNESRTKRVDSREDLGDEPGTTKTKTKGSNPGDGLADQKKEKDRSPKEKAPLMKEEERETGVVSRKVYMSWARAAGGLWIILFVLILYALAEGTKLLSNWWLTFWSEHGNETANSQMRFLGVYAFINIVAILFNVSSSVVMMLVALRASRALFSRLLDAVLRAPMSFFDTTPLGRIINRFSKDIYTLDESLPGTLDMYLFCLFEVISTLFVVSAVTPVFTLCLLPILYFYRLQQKYFTLSYRELKRLDSVQRSPIYALFGETLDGVSTIRAFDAQRPILNRMKTMVDDQQHAYFLTCIAQNFLAVRLELVGTIIVAVACLAAVLEHDLEAGNETFAGLAGLSISYALSVTQSLNWTVRVSSDVEAHMISVERIEQLANIETEAPRETPMDKSVSGIWPNQGVIEFADVKLRYRTGLPHVLKGLSLVIPGRSKVGIVGRTGAGKSTLMAALMRLVEIDEGTIMIDNINTRLLGLQRLRSNIAVIPQDPVLFSGTIKSNLDPFDEFSEERLKQVLLNVGLMSETNRKAVINSSSDEVLEGGKNYSVGQRQLIAIGRALLRNASIIICDEATAAVDAETDGRIQKIFRSEFSNATCLTIAHRINTVLDSDFVLVMDDGRAAEFDTPDKLLQSNGIFRGLVEAWEEET